MRRGLILLFSLMLCGFVFAVQDINNLVTNENVPLGKLLTINGNYNDTNSTEAIFCKFLTKDSDGLIVERLTDELVFANGDFYSQRKIDEPLYKRESIYTVTVTCAQESADTNFTVTQREDITHTVQQEWSFAFDQDNLETVFFMGTLILGLIFLIGILVFWYKNARNTYRGGLTK